jgi:hypothetical protein
MPLTAQHSTDSSSSDSDGSTAVKSSKCGKNAAPSSYNTVQCSAMTCAKADAAVLRSPVPSLGNIASTTGSSFS